MERTPKIGFELAGIPIQFDLTVMFVTTITCLLVLIIALIAARSRSLVPKGMQNFIETIVEFTQGIVRSNLDSKTSERFYGFTFTLFLFIFIANQLGLMFNVVTVPHHSIPFLQIVPYEGTGGEHGGYAWWKSPTADINIPIVMAVTITLFAHFMGIKRSPKHYVAHYFKPFWWMFPLHIIDEIAKPATHGLRLWANIFAGEVLIIIMLKAQWYLTGAPLLIWLGYSFLVGLIQAYVFTVLAIVYISQKLSTDH